MRKVVALVLLRMLPRGGSKFRVWFAKRVCKYEFERQTRSLRAWRVFMMRELETRKEMKALRGARAECPYTLHQRDELLRKVELAHNTSAGGFATWVYGTVQVYHLVPLHRRGRSWVRWVRTY